MTVSFCTCRHRHDYHRSVELDPPYKIIWRFKKKNGEYAFLPHTVFSMLTECRECDCKLFIGAPDSVIFPEYTKQFNVRD